MSEHREHHSALAPLRLPVFRGLWTANVVSTTGGYINDVGAAWLMTSLSPSPLLVSLIQVASNAPFLLLALPAGALGDILNKRKLLLVTQIAMMVLSAMLGVFTLLGLVSPVSLLLILFGIEVFDALAGPAWQTLIPEIVGPNDLRPAITLNSVGISVARSVGPALGGALVALTKSSGPAFLINAASFLGVLVFFWRWKGRAQNSALPTERFFGAMRVGVRYVRYSPRFRATLVRIAAYLLFANALPSLLPVIARSYLHRGPGAYGVLLGFTGVGAVTAVPLLEFAQRTMKLDVLLAISTAVTAGVELATGTVSSFPVLCGIMLVAGVAWVAVLSSVNTAAQSVLPAWVRARAMSVYLMAFFGSMTAGGILWGILATRFGAPLALTIAACGMFATIALIPRFRLIDHEKLDLTPSLHWAAPVIAQTPADDRGPVLIAVEYQVDPQHTDGFLKAMQRLRLQRMRTGAFSWGVYNDTADPTRFVEIFLSETWAEHVRQHARVTKDDQEIEDTLSQFLMGKERPVVRHLVHADLH